jgi:hypothetical protein
VLRTREGSRVTVSLSYGFVSLLLCTSAFKRGIYHQRLCVVVQREKQSQLLQTALIACILTSITRNTDQRAVQGVSHGYICCISYFCETVGFCEALYKQAVSTAKKHTQKRPCPSQLQKHIITSYLCKAGQRFVSKE